jgi:ketosteroid isomerase-like protein
MTPSATSTAAEDEVITLETAYWDAMQANDLDTSLALTYEPCIVTGAQGPATFDHAAMTKMNQEKTWVLKNYTIDNMNVLAPSNDVVVTGYKVKLDMEVEGKSMSKDFAESSTWVKQDGKWLCVQHSESPIGDPFGRDNQSKKK